MELKMTRYRVENRVGYISMDSPGTMNAFDGDMNPELLYQLRRAEQDVDAKVVVLEGTQKVFCAGGNLKAFRKLVEGDENVLLEELVRQAAEIAGFMKRMTKLVVTSVCGAAAGAGAPLALAGDFVLAAENAKFSQAFSKVGLASDTGSAYLLSKCLGPQRAMELCVSGRAMTAQEAKSLGLVHEVYPLDQIVDETKRFAEELAAGPVKAYTGIKRQICAASFDTYESYLYNVDVPIQYGLMKTKDFTNAIYSFTEKTPITFSGE